MNQTMVQVKNKINSIPQIGHDHSAPGTYSGNLLRHAYVAVHREHEHQSKELALSLPEKGYVKPS